LRKIDVWELKPGMIIDQAIYNKKGAMLLKPGTVLTNQYIQRLVNLGISTTYIDDGLLAEWEKPQDLISGETRRAAVNQIENLLLSAQESGRLVIDPKAIYVTVNNFIDELLSSRSLMLNLVDLRAFDNYTFAHSVNVSILSLMTGISLGYEKDRLAALGLGALLHDLGKVKIPDNILNKPGPLTPEEFSIMKRHTYFGYELLKESNRVSEIIAVIAHQHHESLDGTGYPQGVKGKEFHEYAQITAIADKFDALTANRIYRKAFPAHEAFEMCAGAGDYLVKHSIIKAFIYNIAAYPSGTIVQLSNGQIGVVIDTPKGYSLFPRVRILFDINNHRLRKPQDISLKNRKNLFVSKVLSEKEINGIYKFLY